MALCDYLPALLCKFPALSDTTIRAGRKTIDDGFRGFVRSYSSIIDAAVQPLQVFLNYLERLFVSSPWPIISEWDKSSHSWTRTKPLSITRA